MAKKKRAGQITLRVAPEVREKLARIAEVLGVDMNGLLNQIIRLALPAFEIEAHVIQMSVAEVSERSAVLFQEWSKANPERPPADFWTEWLEQLEQKRRGPSRECSQARAAVKAIVSVVSVVSSITERRTHHVKKATRTRRR